MIFENQAICVSEIIEAFTKQRYCLLNALTQSGKTGVLQTVIKIMLSQNKVKTALIITGSAETALKKQFIEDKLEYNNEHKDKISILMLKDLMKFNVPGNNLNDVLIVCDESHLVQSNDQTLDKFYTKFRIPSDGNNEILQSKNCYILSVSATPFSEISVLHHKNQSKKYIQLKPGASYRGVEYYLKNNCIQPYIDIRKQIDDIISFGNRWNIIRTNNKEIDTLKKLCDEKKIDFYEYHTGKSTISIDELSNKPVQPSIIAILGRLRCGQVIPKQHIGSVWETSKTINTDTCIQGLTGRVTGYSSYDISHGYDKDYNIQIYLPSKLIKEKELEHSIRSDRIPNNAMNIVSNSASVTNKTKISTINSPIYTSTICCNIPKLFECNPNKKLKKITKPTKPSRPTYVKRIAEYLQKHTDAITSVTNLNDNHKTEILNNIKNINPKKDIAVRYIKQDTHHQGKDLMKCIESYTTGKPFKGDFKQTESNQKIYASIVFEEIEECPTAKIGDVYIVFKSDIAFEEETTNELKANMNKTNGNTIFEKVFKIKRPIPMKNIKLKID